MLVLAVGIVLSVLAGTRLGRDAAPPIAEPVATTPSARAPRSTPAGEASSPSRLELRSDGWYAASEGGNFDTGTTVRVERVIDGDTLVVSSAGTSLRVRVFGVAAPEVGQRCGSEATARLRALAGDEVRLATDRRQQDAFGRELRYLFTPTGRSIDAALIAEGAAAAWKDDGRFRDTLRTIEAEARRGHVGCLCASTTP